jgi:hypothetical protein
MVPCLEDSLQLTKQLGVIAIRWLIGKEMEEEACQNAAPPYIINIS